MTSWGTVRFLSKILHNVISFYISIIIIIIIIITGFILNIQIP